MNYLKAFLISAVGIFAPIKPLFFASLFLVVADTITGILAARRKGEAITSARLRRCVTKSLVYASGLMVGHVAGVYLLGQDWIAKVIAAGIGVTECLSVMENLSHFSGGNVLKSVISKLSSPNDTKSPPANDKA